MNVLSVQNIPDDHGSVLGSDAFGHSKVTNYLRQSQLFRAFLWKPSKTGRRT
jgi:hypothetical protein